MINPECLINFEITTKAGIKTRGYVVRRLPLGKEWALWLDEMRDSIMDSEESVATITFTSIQKLP